MTMPPAAGDGRPRRRQRPEAPRDQQPTASPPPPAEGPQLKQHRIRRTRAGTAWVAAALFAVILLLLLIFILENGHTVAISFLGASGHLPLGVALLLAAVLGVFLVAIPGTARVIQLRMTARRHRRLDAAAAVSQVQTPHSAPADADPAADSVAGGHLDGEIRGG